MTSDPQLNERHVDVREGYDLWSECYDAYGNPLIALEEPETQRFLGDTRGLEVLDLACGTGRHALRLAKDGARVTGLDFSSGMLDRARAGGDGAEVRWIEHDLLEPLPFADESFDAAVYALAIDHMREPEALLHEFRRVLRPGARAAVTLMHPAMFLKGTQARFVDERTDELVVIENHRHTTAELVMAIRAAGLELVDMCERACTAEIASRIPRAQKYIGWPMLLFFGLVRPDADS